jgi:hypothetical protein
MKHISRPELFDKSSSSLFTNEERPRAILKHKTALDSRDPAILKLAVTLWSTFAQPPIPTRQTAQLLPTSLSLTIIIFTVMEAIASRSVHIKQTAAYLWGERDAAMPLAVRSTVSYTVMEFPKQNHEWYPHADYLM